MKLVMDLRATAKITGWPAVLSPGAHHGSTLASLTPWNSKEQILARHGTLVHAALATSQCTAHCKRRQIDMAATLGHHWARRLATLGHSVVRVTRPVCVSAHCIMNFAEQFQTLGIVSIQCQ